MENIHPAILDNITRIEYYGQPVLTTAQLAEALSTPDKIVTVSNLLNNFRNNRERFIEGKHFFKLEGDALTTFRNIIKNFDLVPKGTGRLMLWTKRGVARHCKSVGTDVAWDVYEVLEDTYFALTVDKDKPIISLSDFERGTRLCKLAAHAKDPFTKKRLVAEAANLILGREEFTAPNSQPVMQLNLFR